MFLIFLSFLLLFSLMLLSLKLVSSSSTELPLFSRFPSGFSGGGGGGGGGGGCSAAISQLDAIVSETTLGYVFRNMFIYEETFDLLVLPFS